MITKTQVGINRQAASSAFVGQTLVIGGTGKTGRRVAARLAARGIPTRIGSRRGSPSFDWQDVSTWASALQGATALYLTYYPDIALPGAVDAIRDLTAVAANAGVRRVVLLSGRGEEEAQRAEQVVQSAGMEWTIVRSSWFAQNFSESYLLEPILSGEVVLPVGDIGEPFIDADDIADVAVAALTEDGHSGQIYEVSGPRLLTFADAVAEIASATNREIRFIQTGTQEYAEALAEEGVPAEFVWLMDYLFTTVLDGRNAHLADGVQRALGREPRDFADYARETAQAGVWDFPTGEGR